MQIELTNEEYKQLIDALVISHMVRFSLSPDGPSDVAPSEQLMQKVFSYAAVAGAEELVEFYPDLGRSYVTQKYADQADVHEALTQFEDQVFWDQLVARLAERDLVQTISAARLEEMDADEEAELLEQRESAYWDVFEKTGVSGLSVNDVAE